jgi:hypothetical protein
MFQELKRHLTSPPVIVAPEPSEPLLLYIAATSEAVSMVLVAEQPDPHNTHELGSSSADGSGSQDPGPVEEPRAITAAGSQSSEATAGPHDQAVVGSQTSEVSSGTKDRELPGPASMEIDAPDPPGRVRTVQRLVYYISEVLHEAKIRYLEVHKLLYAVLIISRKLCHYFQAHRILMVSSYPLRAVLHNPNVTGNIDKWTTELVEFELEFTSRHAIKSQVLTDFIVD